MCGIAGAVSSARFPGDATLAAMARSIAHRGPDGEGIRTFQIPGGWCSLVHRRLSILDLSDAGRQPMASHDDASWIVFNGEIYNYVELRDELRALGHAFRTGTDTEVLLAAWRTWGEDMLPRLNGMFAFAILDPLAGTVFLARDRFGEKPLFYRASAESFAFASEMKALRPLAGTLFPPAAVDERWLVDFLDGEDGDQRSETLFAGVSRLAPGHSLTVTLTDRGVALRAQRWYSLPRGPVAPARDPAAAFRATFDDAVRIRLRSDVPVGTSLSGGLDSSAVVTTIAALTAGSAVQESYTYRSPDERLDETRFARMVAAAARARLHEIAIDPAAVERDFDALAFAQEEPFRTLSPLAQFHVFARARAEGTVVLLDGQGADEILGGYLAHVVSLAAHRLSRGRVMAMRAALACAPANLRSSMQRHLLVSAVGRRLPTALRAGIKRTTGAGSLLGRDARSRLAPREADPSVAHPRSSLDASLRHYATAGPLQGLLRLADRNSMAHGREVRLPFLDHRLVELAFSLPDEEKIGGGFTKRVLRESMAGRIPDEVRLRRDKIGFEAPDAAWLLGPLREWLVTRTDRVLSTFPHLVDSAAVRRALDEARPASPRGGAAVAALLPWIAAEACTRTMSSAGAAAGAAA